jgi:Leucine-rich repeat (LRR) protein
MISDINELENFKQLRHLSLSGNKLKSIEKMFILDIRENDIDRIESIQNMRNLWKIDFSRNNLSQIQIGLFKNHETLRIISFKSNKIKFIDYLSYHLVEVDLI